MAKLFVVPKQEIEELPEPQETGLLETFEVSGDVAKDLENALIAIGFLLDWIITIGPEGLQHCADSVRKFREERQ
jgi:hypothetical protein